VHLKRDRVRRASARLSPRLHHRPLRPPRASAEARPETQGSVGWRPAARDPPPRRPVRRTKAERQPRHLVWESRELRRWRLRRCEGGEAGSRTMYRRTEVESMRCTTSLLIFRLRSSLVTPRVRAWRWWGGRVQCGECARDGPVTAASSTGAGPAEAHFMARPPPRLYLPFPGVAACEQPTAHALGRRSRH